MNNNRLDVIGIGNAMVDTIISSTQEEIDKNNYDIDIKNLELELESEFFSISEDLELFSLENITKDFLLNFTGNIREGEHNLKIKKDPYGEVIV